MIGFFVFLASLSVVTADSFVILNGYGAAGVVVASVPGSSINPNDIQVLNYTGSYLQYPSAVSTFDSTNQRVFFLSTDNSTGDTSLVTFYLSNNTFASQSTPINANSYEVLSLTYYPPNNTLIATITEDTQTFLFGLGPLNGVSNISPVQLGSVPFGGPIAWAAALDPTSKTLNYFAFNDYYEATLVSITLSTLKGKAHKVPQQLDYHALTFDPKGHVYVVALSVSFFPPEYVLASAKSVADINELDIIANLTADNGQYNAHTHYSVAYDTSSNQIFIIATWFSGTSPMSQWSVVPSSGGNTVSNSVFSSPFPNAVNAVFYNPNTNRKAH